MPFAPAVTQSALIAVKNNKGGPTVFRDTPSDTNIRWEGADDPGGADVQHVPAWIIEQSAAFVAMARKGVFTVMTEQGAVDAFTVQDQQKAGSPLAQQANSSIYRPEINDMVQIPCIGPGTVPGASCPVPAVIKQSEQDSRPPLCDAHIHLSSNYIPVSGVSTDDGKPSTSWVIPQLGPRVTESTNNPQ